MNLMQRLIAAGYPESEMEHRFSDLYVEANDIAKAVVTKWENDCWYFNGEYVETQFNMMKERYVFKCRSQYTPFWADDKDSFDTDDGVIEHLKELMFNHLGAHLDCKTESENLVFVNDETGHKNSFESWYEVYDWLRDIVIEYPAYTELDEEMNWFVGHLHGLNAEGRQKIKEEIMSIADNSAYAQHTIY